ncbi:MAG: tol-pal system protein YbgF [Rhizomicrobium sp.]
MKKSGSRVLRAVLLSALLAAGGGLLSGVSADSTQSASDMQALNARLAADMADARALQRRIAADSGEVQVADFFGESDEEKAAEAAAAQREQAQDSSLATLNQQVSDLEDTLRRLTGQVEVLDHRISEFDQRIDRLRKDFDYKLCALSAQQLGAQIAPGDATAIPCNSGQDMAATAPPSEAAPPTGVTHLAPPPGVLGTLPQNALNNLPQPVAPAGAAGQVASVDTRSQFDTAMNLLAQAQYDEARGAFRNFADTYPKDPLAPQAVYWVGDIAYVQKDYPSAARAFAEELKKYPSSPRAPESMLKLGQSLLAMNQKQEGCTALAALGSKYPGASKTIVSQAEAVRRAGGCHR